MTMNASPSHRIREAARLMELYGVSYATACRWVDSGNVDDRVARHLENAARPDSEAARLVRTYGVCKTTARNWVLSGQLEARIAAHERRRRCNPVVVCPPNKPPRVSLNKQIAEVMCEHGVGETTARRWIKSGQLDACAREYRERQQLREDCWKNGVPMAIAHNRRYAGWELEECGLPLHTKRKKVAK